MEANNTRTVGSILQGLLSTGAPLEYTAKQDALPQTGTSDTETGRGTGQYNSTSEWQAASIGYNQTGVSTIGNVTSDNTTTSFQTLNDTSASYFSHQGSTQFEDLSHGGTTVGTIGAGIHTGVDSATADNGKVVPDGAVFLPGVGYVNLTGVDLLPPRPQFHEPGAGNDLWESLNPQVTLDAISRSAVSQLLNTSTIDVWSADSNTSLSNFSTFDNVTVPFIPEGYLSGYSTGHVILTSVFVTLLMIIIIVGNGLVVLAICIDRNLKAVQNWFIASLAISDLLVGLLIMPFSLANEVMGYWYFGNILCELWLATDVLLCTASIMNLCLISLDRFWSITRAISYVKQRTKKRAIIMIALVWIMSMIICFPPLVGWKRPQPMKYDKPLCVLSEDIGYVVYSTLGSFYIPLVVMVVVYVKIYLAARSRARRGLKKAAKQQQQQQPVVDNGKSTTTTTSNTTTSFSTPTRDKACKANNMLVDREFSSFDENCEEALKHEEGADTDIQTDKDEKDNTLRSHQLLTVPNQNVHHTLSLDEKKKLLSEDTDSACESPIRGPPSKKLNTKHIQFSEDTDSTSDSPSGRTTSSRKFNGYRHHGPKHRGSNTEENMKPLLEDSQMESDSQREGEKLSVQNNNLDINNLSSGKSDNEQLSHGNGGNANTTDHHEQLNQVPAEELSSGEQLNDEDDCELDRRHQKLVNNKKPIVLTPASFSRLNLQMRKNKLDSREKHKRPVDDPEKQKRRIARAKERRAFIVLGIIMATFILCWLPFFSTYLISSLTGASVPGILFAIFFWAGYCNSALNPVTYTIFNRDFRQAFSKILFGRRSWS